MAQGAAQARHTRRAVTTGIAHGKQRGRGGGGEGGEGTCRVVRVRPEAARTFGGARFAAHERAQAAPPHVHAQVHPPVALAGLACTFIQIVR
jgi:hypothetical protein